MSKERCCVRLKEEWLAAFAQALMEQPVQKSD